MIKNNWRGWQVYFPTVSRALEAIRWYRRWRTLPVWSWISAAEHFRKANFHQAILRYEEGLSSNPAHPASDSARFDLAYCFYRLDRPNRALVLLRALLIKQVRIADAYLLCSRILLNFGRPVSAFHILENGLLHLADEPRLIAAALHCAVVSSLSPGEVRLARDRAVRCKNRLKLHDSANGLLDTALAHYELTNGDERKGDRFLARVLASGFTSFDAVLLRGERLLVLGRHLPARDQLTRAMRAAPCDPRPLIGLAKIYLASGSEFCPGWAIACAETACRLSHWQDARSVKALAAALEANNEAGKAELYHELAKKLKSYEELHPAAIEASWCEEQKVSNE